MARTTNFDLRNFTQANLDEFGVALMFATDVDTIVGEANKIQMSLTSTIESTYGTVTADDAASELSVDIRTGKAVKGNRVVGVASLSDIQSDISEYVAYPIEVGATTFLYVGYVSSTQSQDYTPAFLASPHIMLTPEQVQSVTL